MVSSKERKAVLAKEVANAFWGSLSEQPLPESRVELNDVFSRWEAEDWEGEHVNFSETLLAHA